MENNEIINYQQLYSQPLDENRISGIDYGAMYEKIKVHGEFTREEKIAYAKIKNKAAYYEHIHINHVFEKLKAERRANDKWKTSNGNIVFQEDQSWLVVSGIHSDVKGRFGVALIEKELGLNSFQAVDWFTDNFGETYDQSLRVSDDNLKSYHKSGGKKNSKLFSPPARADDRFEHVFRYLNEERNIPSTLINQLFDQGKLYSDYLNRCVFLSTASAEIRATPASEDPGFKGCTTGGQADISGFSVMPQLAANESVVAIIEAAIDAISYNAIHPGRYAFSSNGSGRFNIHYKIALETISNGFKLAMATDADNAGDIAAQKVFNALFIKNYIYKKYRERDRSLTFQDIDKAIINEDIIISVDNSPHYLFFNDGGNVKESYPVFKKGVNSENNKEEWLNTGEMSGKTMKFKISENVLGCFPDGHEEEFEVSTTDYKNFLEIHHMFRDRPVKAKDWNDELKILGSKYTNEFNRCFDNNFETLPQIPDYLKVNKGEVMPIVLDENGNARVTKKHQERNNFSNEKRENEQPKEKPNSNSHVNENGDVEFKVFASRQKAFNTLYLRFYMRQVMKMEFEEIDSLLREEKIKFYINKEQPYLNFIDNPFSEEIKYIPKSEEDDIGEDVYYKPTISYIDASEKGTYKNIKIEVNEVAFNKIKDIMDNIAKNLMTSKNQKQVMEDLGIKCFKENSEGFSLSKILGNGMLKKKMQKKSNFKPS